MMTAAASTACGVGGVRTWTTAAVCLNDGGGVCGMSVVAACTGGGRRLMPPKIALAAAAALADCGDSGAHA